MLYDLAQLGDIVDRGDEERAKAADDLMALLTPIAKAFVTEAGYEAANHGVQVYGGHGFHPRVGYGADRARCAHRHALRGHDGHPGPGPAGTQGARVRRQAAHGLYGVMGRFVEAHSDEAVKEFIEPLKYKDEWLTVSLQIGEKAMQNADEAGAAAVDYLMYSGYVVLAYFWARMAVVAQAQIAAGEGDTFLRGQAAHGAASTSIACCRAPRRTSEALLSGADNLMAMPEAMFAF
jgi:hypothetical protein